MGVDRQSVHGVLTKGYGVASGPSVDYPHGALERQVPLFAERGLDLSACFLGTLNIDISPYGFRMVNAAYTFRHVRWTDLHPAEDFSLAPCDLEHSGSRYAGWIYYPHPETKLRNFQNPSLMEIITQRIPVVHIGEQFIVIFSPSRVRVYPLDSP